MGSLTYAARALRQNPVLGATAIVTLALGIGANTAIFSVVKAILLNPLPFGAPDRLVAIAETAPDLPNNQTSDPVTAADWRERSHSFATMGLYFDGLAVLVRNGEGEVIRSLRVSSGFFQTLGVTMELGREFLPEEDRPDRRFTVVILSHELWMRRFASDPHIVGRVLQLSAFHYRVVGVLPESFEPLFHGTTELLPEMYMPAGIDYAAASRRSLGPRVIARLKPGVSIGQARAELSTIMRGIVREHPGDYRRAAGVSVIPLSEFFLGRIGPALWAVLGAVAFVLLIACANVANLLLAQAADRGREIAVRAALGAGRWHLIRQLAAESLLLAFIGGAAGLGLALAGTRPLASAFPHQIPRIHDVHIDSSVLAFCLAATLVTAFLCGLAPAWHASRVDLNELLKSSGKGLAGRARHGLRTALVTAELALAFVLVLGAALMARSYLRLARIDAGYTTRNILTLSSNVWTERYPTQTRILQYYEKALDRLRTLPGVESAAWTSALPLDWADEERMRIEGRPAVAAFDAPLVDRYSVSPDYFHVLGIPLKRGRLFTSQDRFGTPKVALISESCARTLFAGQDPLRQHIRFDAGGPAAEWAAVIGVVGDVRRYGLDRPPTLGVYVPQAQGIILEYYRLVARTHGPPMRLEHAVDDAFRSVDPLLPVYHVKPLDDYLAGTLADRTVAVALLGLFGALALVLAAVGVYGVISYTAAQRSREVGVRIALGAGRRDVIVLVLGQVLAMTASGLGLGFLLSIGLTRLLADLLFEVSPLDLGTSAAALAALMIVALIAGYVPARRAAGVDPVLALREE